MAAEQSAVVDRPDQQRFVLEKEGAEAELVYRTPPGRLVVVHTGVPRHLEGQGLAGRLVRAATERAARERLTLVPQCWYAARWLRRNPDAAATVAIDWDGAGA